MTLNLEDSHDRHAEQADGSVTRLYAWSVFALTFLLMISDYASRQVIVAIFPFLKAEWTLSDTQLGSLASIVPLIVGLMTIPVSLFADRWGRVKSITAMAGLWSLATMVSGFAGNYFQMLTARAVVGLGEAGYGSAGGAILAHVFSPKRRSTVIGGFLAGALFGSVLGVVLGGVLTNILGWQGAFIVVGIGGLLLAALFPLVVRDYQTIALIRHDDHSGTAERKIGIRDAIKELFGARSVTYTYLGSGLQLFVQAAIIAWLPSYLNRFYGLAPDLAAIKTAIVVLISGLGMSCGGYVADRLSQRRRSNKLRVPALYAICAFILLTTAFLIPVGGAQFSLIALGALFACAHAGPAAAVAADVIHPGLRTTALAMVALANNLIGLAPGPFIVGAISDAFGLRMAMAVFPLTGLGAAICFMLGSRHYEGDLQRR